MLAKELKERQDSFITATIGEEEYVIENIKCVASHANIDDGVTYLTLQLRKCDGRNIIR